MPRQAEVETLRQERAVYALMHCYLSICAGLQRGAEPVPLLRRVRRDRRKGARDRLIPGTFCRCLSVVWIFVLNVFCFESGLIAPCHDDSRRATRRWTTTQRWWSSLGTGGSSSRPADRYLYTNTDLHYQKRFQSIQCFQLFHVCELRLLPGQERRSGGRGGRNGKGKQSAPRAFGTNDHGPGMKPDEVRPTHTLQTQHKILLHQDLPGGTRVCCD